MLSCSPAEAGECRARAAGDVLELGSRLLGDVHCARLLLHCLAEHASFFLLTEESWLSYSLDVRPSHDAAQTLESLPGAAT
ncbi:hypothetical protein HF086_013492 [Spodoptera exigua]|uniref:Uncharacterized protein n=1 Tax=Spodoptera exigua TaxID=7107 RepID=A0A922M6P2_SPOEX|nr:hypothetical protein HF086_013492 [Spodoptera exigua]